jgi:hypothetical protein
VTRGKASCRAKSHNLSMFLFGADKERHDAERPSPLKRVVIFDADEWLLNASSHISKEKLRISEEELAHLKHNIKS